MRPIGNTLYLYLPKGVTIVVRSFDSSSSSKVYYCIEMLILVKKEYPDLFFKMS